VMKKIFLILFFFIIGLAEANAKPIVADLSIRSVDIDHDFTGLDILLFGARNDVGRIVVVVRGPQRNYIVRKKEQIAGIWVNSKSVEFKNVNDFYSLAATNPLFEIRNENLLSSLDIGLENIEFEPIDIRGGVKTHEIDDFAEALVKNKQNQNLYAKDISRVSFWGETLFRTVLEFPKNISRGWYTAEIFLFNDGILSAVQSTPIRVSKTGFEAFMFDFAHKSSFFYGVFCVVMAVFSGWAASAIFGRM